MDGASGTREFWLGNLKERDHLEDLGINWKIVLILILNK